MVLKIGRKQAFFYYAKCIKIAIITYGSLFHKKSLNIFYKNTPKHVSLFMTEENANTWWKLWRNMPIFWEKSLTKNVSIFRTKSLKFLPFLPKWPLNGQGFLGLGSTPSFKSNLSTPGLSPTLKKQKQK